MKRVKTQKDEEAKKKRKKKKKRKTHQFTKTTITGGQFWQLLQLGA